MGSRRSGAGADLLKRCDAVGWSHRVTSKGHIMVTNHNGETFTFAPASSDARAHHNALATARRFGLEEAEQRAARRHQRRRSRRLDHDRRDTSLDLSATTTEPQGEPPVPRTDMYTETVMVDAEWATDHLNIAMPTVDGVQLEQRPLDEDLVKHYQGQIERGEWMLSPEGVALAPNGAVLEGMHRLYAIINLETTIPVRVTYNCDPRVFKVLNTGKKRTAANILGMSGEKNAWKLSSALKLVHCYLQWEATPADEAPHWLNWNRLRPSNHQLFGILEQHPELREVVRICTNRGNKLPAPTSTLCAWYYLAGRAWPSRTGLSKRDQFWHQLTTGEMLRAGDPALTLRDWLASKQKEQMTARRERLLMAIINGWNRFCRDQEYTLVKVGDSQHMPRFYRPRSRRADD